VVLGELREGRHTLLERVTLPLTVPANVRAEVMGGGFAHTMLPGTVEVLVGSLLPINADRPQVHQQPRHRHLPLVVLVEHKTAQFSAKMPAHPGRQRGHARLAFRRQPALTPVA
jgi:hypothetical protein